MAAPLPTMTTMADAVRHPEFAKYHKDHPTAGQVVEREGLTGKLTDTVILITGASAGIGVETARALYHTGAQLYLPVRDIAKGEKVKAEIEADSGEGKGKIELLQLDLDSLDSVRQCAAAFLAKSKQLNVLICNAGVLESSSSRTKDGLDMQFGVNHIAHFLLFQLLKDALLSSTTSSFMSRVVVVGSSAHRNSSIMFDDLNMDKQPFNPFAAYGQSKTANAYMALELDRRYGRLGLRSTVVNPGGIPTNFSRNVDPKFIAVGLRSEEMMRSMKTIEQGAATTVWAAVSKEWEGKGGKYLEDVSIAKPIQDPPQPLNGYLPYLYDVDAAKRLWTESLRIVGVKDDRTA